MNVRPIKTRVFKEGETLKPFLQKYLPRLAERTIVVITSKVVALAQGRVAPSGTKRTKIALIRKESEIALHTKYVWLTVKDGTVMASAGIDESNANGKLILLPQFSFVVAASLRAWLRRMYQVKQVGVLITDSRTTPLRAGVTGMAVGYAGFGGLRDYRGKQDLFGRKFHFSRVNVADSLATAAALTMGEGAEQQPLAVITGAPVEWTTKLARRELWIDPRDDMYAPLLTLLQRNK